MTDILVITAIKDKTTKNYVKYITQPTEDPPEFIPESIYVGKHLTGVNQVVINLIENEGVE